MLRSGEMGSLSAGPGSPTDTADKTAKQGEPAPGAPGALSPAPNRFDGGGAPVNRREATARASLAGEPVQTSDTVQAPAEPQAQEPLAGLSITQIRPFAK